MRLVILTVSYLAYLFILTGCSNSTSYNIVLPLKRTGQSYIIDYQSPDYGQQTALINCEMSDKYKVSKIVVIDRDAWEPVYLAVSSPMNKKQRRCKFAYPDNAGGFYRFKRDSSAASAVFVATVDSLPPTPFCPVESNLGFWDVTVAYDLKVSDKPIIDKHLKVVLHWEKR